MRWLRDQLDGDERIAYGADDSLGKMNLDWVYQREDELGGKVASARSADLIPDVTAGVGAHVTEHDPRRVLREIDAKRQMVRWHYRRPAPKWDLDGVKGFECATCDQQFPCKTLRVLALPYVNRPGYREEWRP